MASTNRAGLINKVIKVVKKHFKPVEPARDRNVFEQLIFASCVENSLAEDAEKVFHALKTDYFDWNEIRVSSIRELAEVMKPLNDSEDAAMRVKRVLQSVFETQYSFELEPMKKQNIGQAIKQLEKFHGTTPFTVAYVTQHGLGGHSIPINQGLLEAMRVVGVVSDGEAAKGTVPGLERAVPKTKGGEIGGLLHQLGVELHRSPLGPMIRKILLEIDPGCKDRLPKRQIKKADEPKVEAPREKEAATKKGDGKAAKVADAKKPSVDGKKVEVKKSEPPKAEPKKAPAPPVKKKAEVKVASAKKPVKKTVAKNSQAATATKKSTGKKLAKKKPR